MKEINAIANTLVSTVQMLMPKGSDQVFVVVVRMDFDDYSGDVEKPSVVGYVTLACYAPNNYMRVYAALTPRPPATEKPMDLRLVCSHDSAWRTDGMKDSLISSHRALLDRADREFDFPKSSISQTLGIEKMFFTTIDEAFGGSLKENTTLCRLDPVGQIRDLYGSAKA